KISGFLSLVEINMELQTIFFDDDFCIEWFRQNSFYLWQYFQLTYGHIVALINSFWPEKGVQRVSNRGFPFIHTQGEGLQNKVIIELVNDQLWHIISFTKHQAAVFRIAQFLAVIPAFLQALLEERFIYLILLITREQSHHNL